MGECVEKLDCEHCQGTETLQVFQQEDGSTDGLCFKCIPPRFYSDPYKGITGTRKESVVEVSPEHQAEIERIQSLPFEDIPARGIERATCKHYSVIHEPGKAHYYPYSVEGQFGGYKIRGKDKFFTKVGHLKGCDLFGMNLLLPSHKKVLIVEGELDALAAAQILWKYRTHILVLSVPDGASSAVSACKRNLKFLMKKQFDLILVAMDQQTETGKDPGPAAQEAVLDLLPRGKAAGLTFSEHDPNAMLLTGKSEQFISAVFKAAPERPETIITLSDPAFFDRATTMPSQGADWPWPSMNKWTFGRHKGHIYGFTAGSGVGKTEGFKEVQKTIIEVEEKRPAVFMLEEDPARTARTIAGKFQNLPFHRPDLALSGLFSQEQLTRGVQLLQDKIFIYDHSGGKDWDKITETVHYLATVEGVEDFFIDLLTSIVAREADKNSALTRIMSEMQEIAQSLGVTFYYNCHLNPPGKDGKPHVEGGRPKLEQLKDSRAMEQFSNYIMAYQRNVMAEDQIEKNTTNVWCLKDRDFGFATGQRFPTFYDHNTGRMLETEEIEETAF